MQKKNENTNTDSTPDKRLHLLKQWLKTELDDNKFQLKPASSDASCRRYFRVWVGDKTFIAMDAPDDKDGCLAFVNIAHLLDSHGLHVPHIHAEDQNQGFLLLDDLGNTEYLQKLNATSVNKLYQDAISALHKIQNKVPSINLPTFDAGQTQKELSIFKDSFLETHLHIFLDSQAEQILTETYEILVNNILEQPQVFMHRDYHSRNLMICADNNPGILDFQGAMHGPITYDLASLLRDCYIAWPKKQIDDWVSEYHQQLLENELIKIDLITFTRWFDWTGMQRHLKAIGLFARLDHRDGKSAYLNDIPRTFNYIMTVSENYPELSKFADCMHRLLIPKWITQ